MGLEANRHEEAQPVALVIDDSVDVHRLLRARLKPEGLELVQALSGPEGLTLAVSKPPSVVLLDLDMPEMDGFEVLRNLKENPATQHVPVIVLSGLQSPQDKVTAFDLGAVDYVTKPFDLTELRVRVRAALRLSQLLTMLSQRAQIDGLTGLWNRAHFDKRWPDEVSGCVRHGRALSMAILDMDHFKSVNDTYGHPAGDAVIQGMATQLQRECRQSDVACRMGGEEFAVIMPDTNVEAALVLCERIRVAFEKQVWPRHPERHVTTSIGLVGSSGSATLSAEEWIEAADQNLYRAKAEGRNRVVATDVTPRAKLAQAG